MNDPIDTVLTWGCAIVLAFALALMAFNAAADDNPPKTRVHICDGPLPSLSLDCGAEGGCQDYDVNAASMAHPDYLNHKDDDTFRHVYWRNGDPACVFTADPNGDGVKHVSGGRDLNERERVAYIAEGWHIYAVTGQSCSEAGVPLCGGLFCR